MQPLYINLDNFDISNLIYVYIGYNITILKIVEECPERLTEDQIEGLLDIIRSAKNNTDANASSQ